MVARLAVILSLLLTSVVVASESKDDGTPDVNFRGAPLPYCKYFLLTELSVGFSIKEMFEDSDAETEIGNLTWEVGGMKNVSRRFAAGVTMAMFVSTDRGARTVALKSRLRYWPGKLFALDIAPGLVIGDSKQRLRQLGNFTGHLGVSFADWISAIFRVDEFRIVGSESKFIPYAGLSLGSYPGAIGGTFTVFISMLAYSVSYVLN